MSTRVYWTGESASLAAGSGLDRCRFGRNPSEEAAMSVVVVELVIRTA